MMKKLWIVLVSILLIGLLSACGTTDNTDSTTGTDSGSEIEKETNSDTEENEPALEESDEPEDEGNTPTEQANEDVITETATYQGQADPHSIEVKTENGVMVLQVLEVEDINWDSIELGADLEIEYYENEHGQNILTNCTVN